MIEKREIEIAKEIDDVGALVVELFKVIKKKQEIGKVVDELVDAITGIDQVDDEFKQNRSIAIRTISARMGEAVETLFNE